MTRVALPEYQVMIDWDATNWADTPVFAGDDDISEDVAYIDLSRGKEKEEGNAPASYCQVKLKAGLCEKYSPYKNPKMRIWLPVRVRARHSSDTGFPRPVFFGYLSAVRINPNPNRQTVSLYVTDGLDLLARQVLRQDYNTRTSLNPGGAIARIANAAGWPSARRRIDNSEGSILDYPVTGSY